MYVPLGVGVHSAAPDDEYVPTGHNTGANETFEHEKPAGQGSAAVAPVEYDDT